MTSGTNASNMYQMLCHSAQRYPDSLALAFEQQRYSYREFHHRVQSAMAQLSHGWGLNPGARIVLAWGNHPAFCELFFAALGLGIEVVPFSTKLPEAEGKSLIDHIAPDAVLWHHGHQEWLSRTPGARCVSLAEWQALTLPDPVSGPLPGVGPEDTAVIMFTSGTTGSPKGAVISHGNLLHAVQAYAKGLKLSHRDSTVLAVPIYHITGLSALLALFIYLGGAIWLQQRFNAREVVNTVRERNISFLHGSPTVFILLCQAVRATEQPVPENFPALRAIACGAGHLNQGLIRELKECFPHTAIHPIYGLTETTSPATLLCEDASDGARPGSAGRPIPGLEVAILDDHKRPLPDGEIGQIWLRGEVVIRHYWQPSAWRPACDQNGWFATGDLGYLDPDGYLFVKDRSKDMINRGGEKIYSIDLENLLSTYPGVEEVAIIPAPSPVYGEEPVAFIVPDSQHRLTRDEIVAWLKGRVARFKIPAHIIFTRTLPRTHNGKISKRQLREQLAGHIPWINGRDDCDH